MVSTQKVHSSKHMVHEGTVQIYIHEYMQECNQAQSLLWEAQTLTCVRMCFVYL